MSSANAPQAGTRISLLAGTANVPLAEGVAARLGIPLSERIIDHFADGELHVELSESVRGRDVFLLQPTSGPIETHLVELLLLADACQRAGAARQIAVMPYFGYARQDRRTNGREPVAVHVVANLIGTSAIERVVAVDLHSAAIEGVLPMPLEHLSAVTMLAEAAGIDPPANGVVVAPDLGASKLAEHYATLLNLPIAIVHKMRLSSDEVSVRRITGDVTGRSPIIVDDMITTAGTVAAAAAAVLEAGGRPDVTVIATHALLVGPALERLREIPLRRLIVTDSVLLPERLPIPSHVVNLAPLLATAIDRLHNDQSMNDLIARR